MIHFIQQVTCSEVEEFTKSVKVCEEAKQYQSTTLSILSRSLNEKTIHIKRSLTDTQRVTRAAIEFHNNYDKVSTLYLHVSIYLSIHLSIYQSIYPSIHPCIHCSSSLHWNSVRHNSVPETLEIHMLTLRDNKLQ